MLKLTSKALAERIANLYFPDAVDDDQIRLESAYASTSPYVASRTQGTTATETPQADGKYAKPVYFDWSANWPAVRAMFDLEETQRILHYSVAMARGPTAWKKRGCPGDYYAKAYSKEAKFPGGIFSINDLETENRMQLRRNV